MLGSFVIGGAPLGAFAGKTVTVAPIFYGSGSAPGVPVYSQAAYTGALQALMPRGRAWPRELDATMTAVLAGLANSLATSNASAAQLLANAFPATAVWMLPEWEALFLTTGPTVAARQAAVVAALINNGGQSTAFFVALAAALGVPITINTFTAFSVNASVNQPINGDGWAHVWQVNGPASMASYYTVPPGVTPVVPGFGIPALDALLAAGKPAHTICLTSYR